MSFATPAGIDITRLLDHPLARTPHKTAYIDDHGSISFSELERQAARLARAFGDAGARPGDRAALILPNCIPFIVVEVAILRSALVKVPLNIRFHPREVIYSLVDCEPTILVCDATLADAIQDRRSELPFLRELFVVNGGLNGGMHGGANGRVNEGVNERGNGRRGELRSYEDIVADGDEAHPAGARYGPDDPLLIRYTGGTTGRPKGIVHTAASFLAINLDVMRELSLQQSDVALHLGHLSHGVNFMWAGFHACGITQVLRERFEPEAVLNDFETHRVTVVYMVPTMIQRLLREDDGSADTSSLRMFIYASAPMPVPLLRQAIERYGNIFSQVYTLSEAPVITTMMRAEEHIDRETSVGHRLASCGREVLTMKIRLVDGAMNDVPAGEIGEIAVQSVNNMSEYWRLAQQTRSTLVDGWLLTGDMAVRDEDGYLHIVDRKNDVIITGALNVYPKEVENVLYRHPSVGQVAVVGVPDDEWGEIIKAVVVLNPGMTATPEELLDLCRDNLAGYKKPRVIEFAHELPLSPVGKIMRRALVQGARDAALRPPARSGIDERRTPRDSSGIDDTTAGAREENR